MNVIGGVLWYRRDRILPFPVLVGVLAVFAVLRAARLQKIKSKGSSYMLLR